MSTQEPPFKLPLKPGEHGFIFDDDNDHILKIHGRDPDQRQSRRDRIILCVNAHDRLVTIAREYRQVCDIERRKAEENGLDVVASSWADDIREIDDALADPAAAVTVTAMKNDLVNVFGLARLLKIPRKWLIDEADAGRIPFLRIGRGRRLYNVEAVTKVLAGRAAQGDAEDQP